MRKLISLAMLGSLAALSACSSMDVDDKEAVAENYPADFQRSEYVAMHRDLQVVQVRDSITRYNDAFKKAYKLANGVDYPQSEDNAVLFNDSASLYGLFTEFALYNPDLWDGPATLNSATKTRIRAFSFYGKNAAEDLEACRQLLATSLDSSLIEQQYVYYGMTEGRPYRYCKAGDKMATERDLSQAKLNAYDKPDYFPNTYCLDQASGTIYLIEE